jgi:hypothetical protein
VSRGSDLPSLLDYASFVFLHSTMPPGLSEQALAAVSAVTSPKARAQAVLYLVLTSSDYQVIQ